MLKEVENIFPLDSIHDDNSPKFSSGSYEHIQVALATFMPLLRVFLRVDHVYVHVFSITFFVSFIFLL